MYGNVYNLGNDKINTTKLELVQKICSVLGATFSIDNSKTDPDKRDYIVSNAKVESLGFKPQYSLDMGIQELIGAYSLLKIKNFTNV